MKGQFHSPLARAKMAVADWLECLPTGIRDDAMMDLDRLATVAEAAAQDAYMDGYRSHRSADIRAAARKAAEEQSFPKLVSDGDR